MQTWSSLACRWALSPVASPQGDLSSACAALVALGDPKDVYAAYESALGTSLLASQLKLIESGLGLPVRPFAPFPYCRPPIFEVGHVVEQPMAFPLSWRQPSTASEMQLASFLTPSTPADALWILERGQLLAELWATSKIYRNGKPLQDAPAAPCPSAVC